MPAGPESDIRFSDDASVSEAEINALATGLAKAAERIARKILQDTLPALIKTQVEESLKTLAPTFMESAVAGEKGLIQELIQAEVRLLMADTAQEIIRNIAREVVPELAEAEIKKEITRLTAEP